MRKIGFIFKPEIVRNNLQMISPDYSTVCPSCQTEVIEREIIEKRGSIGCVRCLKI